MPTCVHSPSFLREEATASSANAIVSASLLSISLPEILANVDLFFEASATLSAGVTKVGKVTSVTLANGL